MLEADELYAKKLRKKVNFALHAVGDTETARLALSCLDLTSLSGTETQDDVYALCATAKANNVASVCLYAPYIEAAQKVIKDGTVTIATVVNFPNGDQQSLSEDKATAESAAMDVSDAISKGARQIDVVLDYEAFKSGDTEHCKELLEACRHACDASNHDITMKVILETAAFEDEALLRRACRFAIKYGADCLKTSTGKHPQGGATLQATAVLLEEALHAPREVGVKISGGIKTLDDCAQYIELATLIGGKQRVDPKTFRIGASSVLDELVDSFKLKSLGNGPIDVGVPANANTPEFY